MTILFAGDGDQFCGISFLWEKNGRKGLQLLKGFTNIVFGQKKGQHRVPSSVLAPP